MEQHEIKLTKGKSCIVDQDDYKRLSIFKWCLSSNGYAKRSYRKNGKIIGVYIHREVLDGKEIDHKNGNKLDNRKSNLRSCSRQQNSANSVGKGAKSGFRGVYKNKEKWRAVIKFNYKNIHIGTFNNKINAARAYNQKAKEFFGEFATVNII